MLDAVAKFLPAASTFIRQILPSVVATLIAAVVIATYNSTFSGHLVQPRMGMLKQPEQARPAPEAAPAQVASAGTTTVRMTKPAPVEVITIHEHADVPDRVLDKNEGREAGKDQGKAKIADTPPAVQPAPAAQPVPAAPRITAVPKPRPVERHAEPRPVTAAPAGPAVVAAPMAPPVHTAPPPSVVMAPQPQQQPVIVTQDPPPVITAKPMVTVPDRARPGYEPRGPYDARAPYDPRAPYDGRPQADPPYEQQAEVPPPPKPQGPLGVIVNTLSPSALFARARAFGERIEAAGNDILPNVRPQ